jgi:hypothetical protein
MAPGGKQPYTFYAPDQKTADRYAEDWSARKGTSLERSA